jgi:hypothetical protein
MELEQIEVGREVVTTTEVMVRTDVVDVEEEVVEEGAVDITTTEIRTEISNRSNHDFSLFVANIPFLHEVQWRSGMNRKT